jgi:hypothetical protein
LVPLAAPATASPQAAAFASFSILIFSTPVSSVSIFAMGSLEGKVVGVFYDTVVMVGNSWGGNTDSQNVGKSNTCLVADHAAKSGDVCHDLLCGTGCTRGKALLYLDFHVVIYKTYGNIGSAKVNTDSVHFQSSVFEFYVTIIISFSE